MLQNCSLASAGDESGCVTGVVSCPDDRPVTHNLYGGAMHDSVRAVERALHLMRLMNERESWTLHELSLRSGLAKATLHRLLRTLESEGYVRAPAGCVGIYRLTALTRQLSTGLTRHSLYADVAEHVIVSGTKAIRWPLSFAMAEGAFMRIVACGMPYSPLAAKPTSIGRRHSMFTSAVGKTYLAYCTAAERRAVMDAATGEDHAMHSMSPSAIRTEMREVRGRGYATRFAIPKDLNSAFAVPVMSGRTLFGTLACSAFTRTLDQQFIDELLAPVTQTALSLASALASLDQSTTSSW
jgi:IclR family mhp operon transcriptional activator